MRKIVPSLIWFSALAGGAAWAANVPTNSCADLSVKKAQGARDTIVYLNREYGFSFSLPQSWKGFRVLACRWEGQETGSRAAASGPLIVIRHPRYTEEDPREDIPIMIFTRDQWRAVSDTNLDSALIVSAAPIPPGEIGRNEKYVFALPPRFSFDNLEGVEEVLKIVSGHPLRAAPIGRAKKANALSHR